MNKIKKNVCFQKIFFFFKFNNLTQRYKNTKVTFTDKLLGVNHSQNLILSFHKGKVNKAIYYQSIYIYFL